jgi:hypothetical protein
MFLAYELYAGYLDTHQTAGRADDTPFFEHRRKRPSRIDSNAL